MSKEILARLVSVPSLVVLILITFIAFGGGEKVLAQEPPPQEKVISTGGVVQAGGGTTPVLECAWQLPDMQQAVAGIQYNVVIDGVNYHDDAPSTFPSVNPACVLVDHDANASTPRVARQVQNIHNMIQVDAPNHDLTSPTLVYRDIELWLAADPVTTLTGPTGDVYWDVYELLPDGHAGCLTDADADSGRAGSCWGKKVQVHYNSGPIAQNDFGAATNATARGLGYITGACNDLGPGPNGSPAGTPVNQNSMFQAAIANGEISRDAVVSSAATDLSILDQCNQGVKGLFHASFQLDKDESCGQFKIVSTAVISTVSSSLTNYLDVNCNFNLQTDFTSLDWGTIVPGTTKKIQGNATFGDALPTVGNGNNSAMGIRVRFTSMVWCELSDGVCTPNPATHDKKITQFDTCFGRNQTGGPDASTSASVNCEDPIDTLATGSATADLSDNDGVNNTTLADTDPNPLFYVLCANETGKLDFSIHPPGSLDAGNHTGTVTIIGYAPALDPCYGDIHPIVPNIVDIPGS